MEYLYHGSHVAGIKELKAQSKLHGTDKTIVYLTDNIPYALLYIWDAKHNGMSNKHVTAWVKEGITYYEEQFPAQLKCLYSGVSGWLYRIEKNNAVQHAAGILYCEKDCQIGSAEYIEDVYEQLLQQEKAGTLKVLRYTEQTEARRLELFEKMVVGITRADFYKTNESKRNFMKEHFPMEWEEAEKRRDNAMLTVRPIQQGEADLLRDTSYETMSEAEKEQMLSEAFSKNHEGRYFELLVVEDSGNCVGFMSLYAHSDTVISCGPEIKRHSRQKGYGYRGEQLALAYAKSIGYTEAIAQVRVENLASRALHEKLGFTLDKIYVSIKGREVCEYKREL